MNTLSFSQKLSNQRIAQAEALLGKKVVQKILVFALFLLGLERSETASFLNIPPGTIRSIILGINKRGLAGFEDQRSKNSCFKPPVPLKITAAVRKEEQFVNIHFSLGNFVIRIPNTNPVQKRVVLLSMANSGILERDEVASALELSADRTGKLAGKLEKEDVEGILDKRQGQMKDYIFTPEVKAQVIQQFFIETADKNSVGGEQLAKKLKERCQLNLSPRTILYHLSKLGLPEIKDSVYENITGFKKKILKILKNETDIKVLEQAVGSSLKIPLTALLFHLHIWILLQNRIPETVISSVLGCHISTVRIRKERFGSGDKARSGRPSIIPSEVSHRLMGFYCQNEPLPGFSRWSVRDACRYFQNHPDILRCPVSRSSVHRLLKLHALKPHRTKYFMQICDPDFFPKMEKIIEVYKLHRDTLFCFDECTGLQALERKAPDLNSDGKHPDYIDPEYIRHGTVSIFSVLQFATGQVFTECIPDHTSATIISALRNHVLQYDSFPELHYMCDNYSSHSTEEFCQVIAELCNVPLPKLKKVKERREWLESKEKRIIFHFLPTHGSWLNLIEIWFGILQQKALKDVSFLSAADLENRIMAYNNTWNTEFAHPFRFSYTGKGLHEKVISRFTKWLQTESPQIRDKFLEKQLKLMLNLTASYWPKAQKNIWNILYKTLVEKKDFISQIIGNDENINELFLNLNNVLHRNLKVS